jgi:hypothetical protein
VAASAAIAGRLTIVNTMACASRERSRPLLDVSRKMSQAAREAASVSTGGRVKLSVSQVSNVSRNGSE